MSATGGTLDLQFRLALGRASRNDMADIAGVPESARRAIADGRVEPTLAVLEEVLYDICDLSAFETLAEPVLSYEVEDPGDGELLSERTTATVRLRIPTSDAHLSALTAWAARPSDTPPVLFEPELRTAILAMAAS